MKLKPGTILLVETRCQGVLEDSEEFLVCRTGENELNLFSTDDFNRWTDEGFKEGITIEEWAEREIDIGQSVTLTNKYPFFMEV